MNKHKIIKLYSYGGCTGVNDYLMTDGSIKAFSEKDLNNYNMTDRLKHGTKYPKVDKLPKGAALLSTYKDIIGVKNAASVCVKYDRFLSGESKTNPGYKIVNFQGLNFAISN